MRGIDEPSKDLHALKQILEALQLKGLLHSNKSTTILPTNQSPIVVMKPNRNRSPPPPSATSPRARNSSSPSVRSPNRMRKTMINAEKVAPVHSRIRNEPQVQQVTSRSPRIRKPTYHKEEKNIESHTTSLQVMHLNIIAFRNLLKKLK